MNIIEEGQKVTEEYLLKNGWEKESGVYGYEIWVNNYIVVYLYLDPITKKILEIVYN